MLKLDLDKTYRAILDAARAGQFISYGALAKASNVDWSKARRPIAHHLDEIVRLASERGWPMISSIVVNQNDLVTGRLEGRSLDGFLEAARRLSLDIGDPQSFLKRQQDETFEWAKSAPDDPGFSAFEVNDAPPRPADSLKSAATPEAVAEVRNLLDDPTRRFWFVGASWGGTDDQTPRFLAEGIWQNGYSDKFLNDVLRMKAGDKIAIKATFVRKLDLPFDNRGRPVSCMRIKATGTVTANRGDGRTVDVDWEMKESRDWFFYTYRTTLIEADPNDEMARRLIVFAFARTEQDYRFWLALPYFARKYAPDNDRSSPDEIYESESSDDDSPAQPYALADIVDDGCFLDESELKRILARLSEKKNLILQGPPGTGKTWLAKRLAYALVGTRKTSVVRDRVRAVQFHPSMSYEDFVRGWRPSDSGRLQLVDGVFLEMVDAAKARPDQPFVLVIEEINRGNPAQIFGEMLTLLESSKRSPDEALELAYRRSESERIHLPRNLHVIGTMNIADRSLALVDLALRRRFAFVDLVPQLNERWRGWCRDRCGMPEAHITIIERKMARLNEDIAADRSLGPQFQVGHSYVTPTDASGATDGLSWFEEVVNSEIVPLLEEYWFDNAEKVSAAKRELLESA